MNAIFVLLSAPSFSVRESDLWGGTTGTRQKSDIFKSCTNLKRSDDTSQFQKDQHRCNLSCSAVKTDSELSRNVRKVETRISGAFEALPIFSRSYQVAAKLQKNLAVQTPLSPPSTQPLRVYIGISLVVFRDHVEEWTALLMCWHLV